MSETVRNNKQIWRLAEWLYWNVFDFIYPACERFCVVWEKEDANTRNHMYDKALELQKKLINNEFVTTSDNHED